MNYPLSLSFKVLTFFGQQMTMRDARGEVVYYVKQKAFKLKEDVLVYADEAQTKLAYRMQADRILDISAAYNITLPDERSAGSLKREGMKSFWKATYQIKDSAGADIGVIHEENPWMKALEFLLGEIPILGTVAGYVINPAYLVEMPAGRPLVRVQKRASIFERSFRIELISTPSLAQETLLFPAILMMVLLERGRG